MQALEPLFTQSQWLVIIVPIVGLMVGSFLNVVIYRLPIIMNRAWRRECSELLGQGHQGTADTDRFGLAVPNSRCPACGAAIKPWHNIPVISYLLLRGRCAVCSTKISLQYPIVEITTCLLSLAVVVSFNAPAQMFAVLFIVWTLVALTAIDINTQLLPDSITQPLLWLGLLLNYSGMFTTLESALLGAVLGYLSLWSVYWLFRLVTGKEGMGYGDFKLLAALGAWFGWQALPLIILLSSLVGAAVGIGLIILANRGKDVPMPFGPYLAGAGLLWLFFGDVINAQYLNTFAF